MITRKEDVLRLLRENPIENVRHAVYANQGILTYFKVKNTQMAAHQISDALIGFTVLESDGALTQMTCKMAELNPAISEDLGSS
jgi:hypothetical protein